MEEPASGEGALNTSPTVPVTLMVTLKERLEKPLCPTRKGDKSPQWVTKDQKEGFCFKLVG